MISDNISISLQNVSKKFSNNLNDMIKYGIVDIAKDIVGIKNNSSILRKNEFWAVKDVSFDLHPGDILGIIGSNGAGKSTLLKMLNGIFYPDAGMITMKGKVGALIELGAGFHPLLTGRENIYVNGSIMGMRKSEIEEKIDQIIEFADIREFIDMSVKFYSSGMYARLGFSIAVHMDIDILLVDEVLAVGDQDFQAKSIEYMAKLINSGKAVIIVSHSLYRIESLCNKAIWLDKGKIREIGKPKTVIKKYLEFENSRKTEIKKKQSNLLIGGYPITINSVEIINSEGRVVNNIEFEEKITIRIHFFSKRKIDSPLFNIRILNDGRDIIEVGMNIDGPIIKQIFGSGIVECKFESLPLTPKEYEILIWVSNKFGAVYLYPVSIVSKFKVTSETINWNKFKGPMALNHFYQGSPIYLPHSWSFI